MSFWDDATGFIAQIPIVGDVLGSTGLIANPEAKNAQEAMQKAKDKYEAYRPEMWAARMGAMNNALSAFDPYMASVNQAYGYGSAPNASAAFEYDYSTAPPGSAQGGQPQAQPGGAAGQPQNLPQGYSAYVDQKIRDAFPQPQQNIPQGYGAYADKMIRDKFSGGQ